MAKRFMKAVSIVLPLITVVILASQLLGHAAIPSVQLLEELQKGDEVVIEYVEPDQTPLSGPEENRGGYDYTSNTYTESEESEIGLIDTEESSNVELEKYFKEAFRIGQKYPVYQDEESNIKEEIGMVRDLAQQDKVNLPSDYGTQYRTWRIAQLIVSEADGDVSVENAEAATETAVSTPENELTFTDCNETVYATSQVNMRTGPGTNYDKVGSLGSGQSVVRTGIGYNSCDGWSRIQLSDGSTVYVSSNYISTTKPVTQQNNGGQTNTQSGGQSNNGGQTNNNDGGGSQTNQPSSGGKSYYGGFNTYEEYINDLHRQYPQYTIEQLKEIKPDLGTIYVDVDAAAGAAKDGLLG